MLLVLFSLFPSLSFAQNNSWMAASSDGFTPRSSLTCSTVNGKIYAIGGSTGTTFLNTLEVFDPITNSWTTPITTGSFSILEGHTACVFDSKIYVIGGDGSHVLSIFDPATNNWTTPTTTGHFTNRGGLTSALYNGKIYTFGGNQGDIGITNLQEIFDPSTNSWSTPVTTGTFTPRTNLCSAVINNKIYVLGGQDTNRILNTLEVFDPVTNIWTTPQTTGTFTARWGFGCGVINGKIYVFGGSFAHDHTEVFDPVTNVWSTVNTTGAFTDRGNFGYDTVNGKIYTMGGSESGQGAVNINEVFTASLSVSPANSDSANIVIHPNPTTENISLQNLPENTINIQITNVLGQTIAEFNPSANLDLTRFQAGVYYVKIITSNSIITQKIIKE